MHPIFKQSGRPKKDQEPEYFEYQITGYISSSLNVRSDNMQQKGFFILTTNDLSETLTMEKC